MIAATAYDICCEVLRESTPGSQRYFQALAAIAEWEQTGALDARIEPRGGAFVLLHKGRVKATAPTLRQAQNEALSWGYRVLDITACGVFA